MKRLFCLCSAFLLCSCASVIEGATQPISIETPGTENALCYIESVDWRYTVRPPQTINITKAADTLDVRCLAPGNREQIVQIEPVAADTLLLNIGTALLPGLAYDRASGAMYKYPELVVVDFRGIPTNPMPLPARYATDIEPPMERGLEEFRSGSPGLSEDADLAPVEIRRRVDLEPEPLLGDGDPSEEQSDVPPVDAQLLGDALRNPRPPRVASEPRPPAPPASGMDSDDLTKAYNPGVFSRQSPSPAGQQGVYAPPPAQYDDVQPADNTPLDLFLAE